MAWLGIWFEPCAGAGEGRSPELLRGLAEPIVYPYAHSFVEAETERLTRGRDPGRITRGGERFNVYYSLNHDATQTGLDQQGCRILNWLFMSLFCRPVLRTDSARASNFATDSRNALGARF